jgi:hypothetical protein
VKRNHANKYTASACKDKSQKSNLAFAKCRK